MKALKFGGTSVGSPERMNQVYSIITSDTERKIVVLSAVSGTTNTLVDISTKLSKGNKAAAQTVVDELFSKYEGFVDALYASSEYKKIGLTIITTHFDTIRAQFTKPYSDATDKTLLAQGELISTNLFVNFLKEKEIQATLVPALDFMRIDQNNEPDIENIEDKLPHILNQDPSTQIFITQGFICRNPDGDIDNLRRGGSDYTATLIGSALKCEETQIWTDIDGMHNNDPRIVDHTRPISDLSFQEAGELAYFGAKILHPSCIIPAEQKNVPVRLKNTMDPQAYGTLISSEVNDETTKAIAAKDGITAIKIKSSRMLLAHGFLRKVFEVFEKYQTSVDMITTSEIAVSVTIDDDSELDNIVNEIRPYGTVEVDKHQTIVCIVGNMVATKTGFAKDIFASLNHVPVRMISYGGSKNNSAILVDSKFKEDVLKSLNKGIFGL